MAKDLFHRALGAFVNLEEDTTPPINTDDPKVRAAIDEFDAGVIRTKRNAPPITPAAAQQPQPLSTPTVDRDGVVNFAAVYAGAQLPEAEFPAEKALALLNGMPKDIPEASRRQMLNLTLSTMGEKVGATPVQIAADATRKLDALAGFLKRRSDDVVRLTGDTMDKISELEGQIAKMKANLDTLASQQEGVVAQCKTESANLETVLEFFDTTNNTPTVQK